MPWTAAHQAFPFFTISQSLFKLMFIELLMPSNHLVICCPLLILASVFPSIGVLSIMSALCIRWLKYWSFSFSISPSSVYLGLTGLISLLSKGVSRVFSHTTVGKHQFFGAQLSLWFNSHIHTWLLEKTKALTRWNFVSKEIALLFIKYALYISHSYSFKGQAWLQSPSAVILEPRKIVSHCFHCFPMYLPWSDETKCNDLHFYKVEF